MDQTNENRQITGICAEQSANAVIERFRNELIIAGRSSSTIGQYCRGIKNLYEWAGERPVTQQLLNEWKQMLTESMEPRSVNVMLAAVNCFSRIMGDELGWNLTKQPFVKLQRSLYREGGPELTEKDYRRIVRKALIRGDTRTAMIIVTLCSLGIRVSDLRFITAEAVRKRKAVIYMKGRTCTVTIPNSLATRLKDYMRENGIRSGQIFITSAGKSLTRSQIWKKLKETGTAAGVDPEKVFPDSLRLLFVRTYYNRYKDFLKFADMPEHSSMETAGLPFFSMGEEHAGQPEKFFMI